MSTILLYSKTKMQTKSEKKKKKKRKENYRFGVRLELNNDW